jgi:hypothetical protein
MRLVLLILLFALINPFISKGTKLEIVIAGLTRNLSPRLRGIRVFIA